MLNTIKYNFNLKCLSVFSLLVLVFNVNSQNTNELKTNWKHQFDIGLTQFPFYYNKGSKWDNRFETASIYNIGYSNSFSKDWNTYISFFYNFTSENFSLGGNQYTVRTRSSRIQIGVIRTIFQKEFFRSYGLIGISKGSINQSSGDLSLLFQRGTRGEHAWFFTPGLGIELWFFPRVGLSIDYQGSIGMLTNWEKIIDPSGDTSFENDGYSFTGVGSFKHFGVSLKYKLK